MLKDGSMYVYMVFEKRHIKISFNSFCINSKILFTCRSVCLLMQAALPCFLMGNGPGTMMLRGGTNAEMAPPIDYTVMVCTYYQVIVSAII